MLKTKQYIQKFEYRVKYIKYCQRKYLVNNTTMHIIMY